jgi:hypothetical protein
MSHMSPFRQLSLASTGLVLATVLITSPALAQEREEPVFDDLMDFVTQPGFEVGALFQAVVDPSVDGNDPQSASVSLGTARLLVGGIIDNGFRYFLQTDFAAAPSVLDARVGWVHDDRFGVWAGRFKTPFNQELLDYAGVIDFVNRSRVVSRLGPDRQYGVQVATRVGIATVHLGGFTGPNAQPTNEDLIGVARVSVVPELEDEQRLRAGVSAAFGRDGAVGGRAIGAGYDGEATLFQADIRYERGPLLLAGEGMYASYRTAGGTEGSGHGWYTTAGWRASERTQLLLRWDRYTEPATSGNEDADDNLVFGFNAWPTQASEIQVNYVAPIAGSAQPHKLVINFQVGFGGQQALFQALR